MNDPLVLECARAIRLYLPDLLGAEEKANSVDLALAELLAQADQGHQVEERILDLLREPSDVHNWAAAFLQHGVPPDIVQYVDRSSYQPPAGDGDPVGALKYACPVAGDTLWWRRAIGQEVPRCLTHGVPLQPANKT